MKNNLSGKLLDIQTHRKFAKIGMATSLGIVTLTAFNMKNNASKKAHIIAGASLVAFSIYHTGLYNDGIFKKLILKRATKQRNLKSKNV